MVKGIGTDLLKIQRIINFQSNPDDPFFLKIFTKAEHAQAVLRSDPTLYYATRFAGKEAVFKCFGIDGNHVRLHEIEILSLDNGMPQVTLHGHLKEIAAEKKISRIELSLSYEDAYAIAFAVAHDEQ